MYGNSILKIKKQLMFEFEKRDRQGIYAKFQKMMAYNSNKIEGSTLTSEQTASLFDTGSLYATNDIVYRAKDIEEMNGHFKLFNKMLKTLDEPLTEDMIKGFHYELKVGVFEDMANGYPVGEYKNRENIVSDIKTASPDNVSVRIRTLLDRYNGIMNIEDIAVFHAEFEMIHPFQDGNGRTGRMIILKQCLENDIFPVLIEDKYKIEYYHALHRCQVDGSEKELISLFEKEQGGLFEEIRNMIIEVPDMKPNIRG